MRRQGGMVEGLTVPVEEFTLDEKGNGEPRRVSERLGDDEGSIESDEPYGISCIAVIF